MNPANDTFISVAPQEALCFWDLRVANALGRLGLREGASPGPSAANALAAYDPQGLIFAVAVENQYLRFYDARKWERGHFASFQLNEQNGSAPFPTGRWNGIKFSPDGERILVSVTHPQAAGFVLDAFKGDVIDVLGMADPLPPHVRYSTNSFAFTPDAQWIAGGRSDGTCSLWSTAAKPSDSKPPPISAPIINALPGYSREAIQTIAFNPKMATFITTADTAVCFHLPIYI